MSAIPHVVSTVIARLTYVIAAAWGETAKRAPNPTPRIARTVTRLCARAFEWARGMADNLLHRAVELVRQFPLLFVDI
ncbi:MAG: hypothetical protein E6K18_08190 [Methanobacteriota archaeon]|nr:MAG: hypothetical protein E6K18_08190 [Euryarchaeota archaeon]